MLNWIVALIAGILFWFSGQNLRFQEALWVEPPLDARRSYQWHPVLFKTLSFGHWAAAIDWLWIRSLQDPSYLHVEEGKHPPFFYDLDLATELDPAFYDVYVSGVHLLAIIRDDIPGALHLLDKADDFVQGDLKNRSSSFRDRYWSRPWQVYVLLGYVYLFEKEDLPSAANAFSRAGSYDGAPIYLKSLGERLNTQKGQYEVGLRLLNFMIQSVKKRNGSPAELTKLEEKRKSLFLAQFMSQLNSEFRVFLRKDLDYQRNHNIRHTKLRRLWSRFKRDNRIPSLDPWGGRIELDSDGQIRTQTPYRSVFGIE